MARIRTIKPSFWAHEELSALPEATHMLAASLLNYADDEGYFNANPGLVRAACCPLREPSVSVPESLQSLHAIKYIRLGTGADGKRYGQVVKFSEHQKVSHAAESKIAGMAITWDEFPEDSGAAPESLRPELNRTELNRGEGNRPGEDVQTAFDEYNALAEQIDLSVAQVLTPERASKIRQRLDDAGGLDGWRQALAKVRDSPFLAGLKGDWAADLDFMLQKKSFTKLMEGGYDERGKSKTATGFAAAAIDLAQNPD